LAGSEADGELDSAMDSELIFHLPFASRVGSPRVGNPDSSGLPDGRASDTDLELDISQLHNHRVKLFACRLGRTHMPVAFSVDRLFG
jgi:hypothetical protein